MPASAMTMTATTIPAMALELIPPLEDVDVALGSERENNSSAQSASIVAFSRDDTLARLSDL